MDIKLWKENIISAVEDIANKDFQERVWLHETDEVSSPVEVYCTLFDDFSFNDFLESHEANLTNVQKKAGYNLIEALDQYSPSGEELPSPEYMIGDPRWDEVRVVAQNFLDVL